MPNHPALPSSQPAATYIRLWVIKPFPKLCPRGVGRGEIARDEDESGHVERVNPLSPDGRVVWLADVAQDNQENQYEF